MIWTQYQDIRPDDDLIAIYKQKTQQVYDKAKFLIQAVNGVFMDIDDEFNFTIPSLVSPGDLLNRAMYLWTVKVSQDVQRDLNAVVDIFNAHGLVDEITNKDTEYLIIWQPRRLVIDKVYFAKLNSNYKSANALLDRLFNYIKPYLN